jgi:hypothetical protein
VPHGPRAACPHEPAGASLQVRIRAVASAPLNGEGAHSLRGTPAVASAGDGPHAHDLQRRAAEPFEQLLRFAALAPWRRQALDVVVVEGLVQSLLAGGGDPLLTRHAAMCHPLLPAVVQNLADDGVRRTEVALVEAEDVAPELRVVRRGVDEGGVAAV